MTTIILSAGHYPEKPGAVWDQEKEHDHNIKWMNYVMDKLAADAMVVSIDPSLKMKATVDAVNRVADAYGNCVAIEFHFNAAGDLYVEGNETLHFPSSTKSKQIAEIYNKKFMEGALKYVKRDRGVKPGWYHGDAARGIPLYYLQHTKCPSLIIEPCFMCQLSDIGDSWTACCDSIVEAILHVIDKTSSENDNE